MGYQQSIVKVKEGQFDNFMYFLNEEEEWMKSRGLQPNCCVRVAADIEILKSKYIENEVCVIIEGDRHYQRGSEPDGLWGLDYVESVLFVDNVPTKILNDFFPRIEEDEFYKRYFKTEG